MIQIPLLLNKLEEDSFHILLKDCFLSKEEKESIYWIVDSGASRTVLDSEFSNYFEASEQEEAQELNGIGYKTYSDLGFIPELHLENKTFIKVLCNCTNLNGLREMYLEKGKTTICGMIGCDFLIRNKAVLNFEKMCLEIFVD